MEDKEEAIATARQLLQDEYLHFSCSIWWNTPPGIRSQSSGIKRRTGKEQISIQIFRL